MNVITLPNNGTTISLNGNRLRHLAEGDSVTVTYANPRTGRVNSETGVTIHERSDAEVATIVVNVQKYSDDDIMLSALAQSKPLTVVEGSIKSRFVVNGEERNETFTIEAGSITDQAVDTKNSQDGNAVKSYTIESRRTKRAI